MINLSKKKEENKMRIAYYADDGTEFETQGQCTMKVMNGMKIYMICPHMI